MLEVGAVKVSEEAVALEEVPVAGAEADVDGYATMSGYKSVQVMRSAASSSALVLPAHSVSLSSTNARIVSTSLRR